LQSVISTIQLQFYRGLLDWSRTEEHNLQLLVISLIPSMASQESKYIGVLNQYGVCAIHVQLWCSKIALGGFSNA